MHADSVGEFLRTSTEEIWDQKMMGRAGRYYSSNAVIHLAGGEAKHGSDQMLADLVGWLAAFPDTRVFVDDIIWSKDADEYRTSVRETIVGHNTGVSIFGPPTGRRIVISRIVNSRIQNERFAEQWIEWDEAGLIRQLGLDERQVVADRVDTELPHGLGDEIPVGVTDWGHRAAKPEWADIPEGLKGSDLIQAAVAAIWNGRLPGSVARFYAEQYRAHVTGRRIFGPEEVQGEVLAMLAAFPDLHFHVDDIVCQVDQDGQRSSTRWTMVGTNSGPSTYGPPSNRYVRLTGITNHRIRGSHFQKGWTEYSELSLLRQIAPRHEGAPEGIKDE